MKLEIFNFIDESIKFLKENEEEIKQVAKFLNKFFVDSFAYNDHFSQIVYRIKSPESLKEKILRNNFYVKYQTPKNLFRNLHDLIGLRLECRFTQEEKILYEDILRLFNVEIGDGFFSSPLNPNIEMNLSMPQPQIQQNGFEIYKIDGHYNKNGKCYNFELQMKSMVNVFWSEIEHKILYKNFNYVVTENFFRDMMSSINENLTMIDKQLMLVYKHLRSVESSSVSTTKTQMKSMLSKMIHDMFAFRVHHQTGLMLDFKYASDLLVDYMFFKSIEKKKGLGQEIIFFIDRLNIISRTDLDFTTYIQLPCWSAFENDELEEMAQCIAASVNEDYKWNLFFRILFLLEDENQEDQFKGLVYFIYQTWIFRVVRGMQGVPLSEKDKGGLLDRFYQVIFSHWSEEGDIDFLNMETMRSIEKKVASFLEIVERPEDIWSLDFEEFYQML